MRDVQERGRDIDGIIKQWFGFVKPSYKKYVEPQRTISGESVFSWDHFRLAYNNEDIIIPRGIENKTAIGMKILAWISVNTAKPLRYGC